MAEMSDTLMNAVKGASTKMPGLEPEDETAELEGPERPEGMVADEDLEIAMGEFESADSPKKKTQALRSFVELVMEMNG